MTEGQLLIETQLFSCVPFLDEALKANRKTYPFSTRNGTGNERVIDYLEKKLKLKRVSAPKQCFP